MENKISAENAINLLIKGKKVHTFRQGGPFVLGANMDRKELIALINKFESTLEIASENARGMQHGLVLHDDPDLGPLFIETDEKKLNAFDPI